MLLAQSRELLSRAEVSVLAATFPQLLEDHSYMAKALRGLDPAKCQTEGE